MARITIEDCIEQIPNRFQLVQMTAIRAKQLKKGATALVQNDANKEVVVALREIAAGKIKPGERIELPVEAAPLPAQPAELIPRPRLAPEEPSRLALEDDDDLLEDDEDAEDED
jgi:DNA-directed RNA polymerase subunit omega